MNIGIFTVGSRGDVQPYIALALALVGKGYKVTLAAPKNFKEFIESYGIEYFEIYGDMHEFLHSEKGKELLNNGSGLAIAKYMYNEASKIRFKLRESFKEGIARVDIVVANLTTAFLVEPIVEKLAKKWAIVNLNPPAVPTREFPFIQFDFFNFPWFNLWTYRLVRSFIWSLNRNDFNEFRSILGLAPLKISLFDYVTRNNIPVLHCFSPSLIVRPSDWNSNHKVTGLLNLAGSKDQKIPIGFEEWLSGERPVYIGFGSMPIPQPGIMKAVIAGILRDNHRVVYCEGWSKLGGLISHKNLYVLTEINHDWLFPRCKLALIHGGIGTISSALRAKIPVIVASISADQPMWGKIISKRKLGVHIPFKKMTVDKVLEAIHETQTPSMLENINLIGEKLNNEDGVGRAVEVLEEDVISKEVTRIRARA